VTEPARTVRAQDPEDLELDPTRVVIRDKRRIDPISGELRPDAAAAAPSAPSPTAPAAGEGAGQVGELTGQLAERTADLQRLQAEYANYRKRVERDRLAVADRALASVLLGLLPVLDDIGRARAHGELGGGFKSVAEALEATLVKLGLDRYGEPGDPFDPTIHEALTHSYSADVDTTICVQIMQPGYRVNGRILRPALVGVAEPAELAEPTELAGPAEPTKLAEPAEPAKAADVPSPAPADSTAAPAADEPASGGAAR
jgi:molecular chaperone GrpE